MLLWYKRYTHLTADDTGHVNLMLSHWEVLVYGARSSRQDCHHDKNVNGRVGQSIKQELLMNDVFVVFPEEMLDCRPESVNSFAGQDSPVLKIRSNFLSQHRTWRESDWLEDTTSSFVKNETNVADWVVESSLKFLEMTSSRLQSWRQIEYQQGM